MIFFDAEVFEHDWLIVFMVPESQSTVVIHNDVEELRKFYETNKTNIFVGYNVKHYDQYIMKSLLLGLNPYEVSQFIIEGNFGWEYSREFFKVPMLLYDVMIATSSLKELEGHMGNSIEESEVSFDIDRPLTPQELQSVINYCKHDVEQTIEIFLHTKTEFDSQMSLIKAFKLPIKHISKTKAQMSALIIGAEKRIFDDEFDLRYYMPETMILKTPKHQDIFMWYLEQKSYENSLKVTVAGVLHEFGWGGLHGAIDNYIGEGLFLSVDVASYYPSLMIEYDFLSRAVVERGQYKKIYHDRLKFKAEGNPLANPYKIVLNSTYGAMKNQYNNLYDPLMANMVCVSGQLLLLDLIEKLEPHWELIQSNTDGLIGKLNSANDVGPIKTICEEWSARTRMVLEYETFGKIFQKDVNNYIIVHDDGKYKSKGAYVKKLSPIDYDLPIVNEALINYFLHNVPVEETVKNCNRLIKFQKIVKITYKYKSLMHGPEILNQKCVRAFASKDLTDEGIFKIKNSNRASGVSAEKIANTPKNCFIDNSDINQKRVPRKLNKQWYIDLALQRINDFIKEEELF